MQGSCTLGCRSPCQSQAHCPLTCYVPQKLRWCCGDAAPPPTAPPALCCSLDGAPLFDYFFHHAFLISLRGVINQVPHERRGFRRSQRYHSNKGSPSSCSVLVCLLLAGAEGWLVLSAACEQAPDSTQRARLSGKWKGYRLFCRLDLVLIMFKYLKVTKLQTAEIWHKGLSLRLPRFAGGRQQKGINRSEQKQPPLLRCYSSH